MAERKIQKIGLALSGGGYRAAGFHLGVLDMLGRLQLLDRVKGLSTVSGGTITGAHYAASVHRGERYDSAVSRLADWLRRTNVIAKVMYEQPPSSWSEPGRRRNLITGAAELYNDLLGCGFGALFDQSGHLEDVIFNTTEFQNGLDFRFQKVLKPGAFIGNKKVNIDEAAARQVRLGDIVAASSCFPAGFEPLEFPLDFVFPGDTPKMPNIPKNMALMDGGIYDNQGTEALLLARDAQDEYDVVVISDTDQKEKEAYYAMPTRTSDWRGLPVSLIFWLIVVGGALTLGAGVAAVWQLFQSRAPWWAMALCALPPLVSSGLVVGMFVVYSKVKGLIAEKYPDLAGGLRHFLFQLRWADLVDLVKLRLGSLVALTSSVFLKRIRQLGYKVAYADEALKGKIVANMIYAMARKQKRHGNRAPTVIPTAAQKDLANRANKMPTTLWFDNEQEFRDVFAAGQNTIVYSLLRWCEHEAGADTAMESAETTQLSGDLAEVAARLKEMWTALQADPFRFTPGALDAKSQMGGIARIGQGFEQQRPAAAAAQAQKESA